MVLGEPKKAVFYSRLIARVVPPSPRPILLSPFYDFCCCFLTWDCDYRCFELDFTQIQVIFIQLLDSPFPQYGCSLSQNG